MPRAPPSRRRRRRRILTQKELTAEDDEEAPQTFLTITDSVGKVVRRLVVPVHARHPSLCVEPARRAAWRCLLPAGPGGGGGGGGQAQRQLRAAGHVSRVALARVAGVADVRSATRRRSRCPPIQRDARRPRAPAAGDYQDKVFKLQRSFTGALEQANNMKTRTTAIRRAIADSPADLKLLDEAVRYDQRVTAVLRTLRGDETLRGLESGLTVDDPVARELRRHRRPRADRRADRRHSRRTTRSPSTS